MYKSVQITMIIVIGVLVLGIFGFSFLSNFTGTNTVTGNGHSSMEVLPDLVSVYFNVETKGNTSKEANEKNSEIVDILVTDLIKNGFERNQIQTINFNVYPEYDWRKGERIEKGYRATHTIKVEMSSQDTSKIGQVIDAGADAGAGISYISFELSQDKQNKYKAEALKLAAEDARLKAQSIADGLGKKLGNLVSTSDNNFDYYPWRIYEASAETTMDVAEAKAATTNIQPGEQRISATVIATFKLR